MFNENPVPPKCLTVHFENKAEEMGVISTEKERGSPGVHAWTAAPPDGRSNTSAAAELAEFRKITTF